MDEHEAAQALSALSHPTRMRVFRTLSATAEAGMGSSDIADAVGIPPNLMSAHLAVLAKAGVLMRRSSGRSRIYSVSNEAILDLADHLRGLVPSSSPKSASTARTPERRGDTGPGLPG